MSTKVVVTIREASKADWDRFCEVTGVNPWCLNEGTADGDETYSLDLEEAAYCGLLKDALDKLQD